MRHWFETLRDRLAAPHGESVVRVTVAATRGSAPRDAGACMLVGDGWQEGTIGGGHLELVATRAARTLLAADAVPGRIDRFPLGAALGQCCGGVVALWLERFTPADLGFVDAALARIAQGGAVTLVSRLGGDRRIHADAPGDGPRTRLERDGDGATLFERLDEERRDLWIFGAGHVGRALVAASTGLPFAITWIDSREDAFDDAPRGIRTVVSPAPADEVASAPAGAMFLVMTHSHDEDDAICRALLQRRDFAWAGLIGSATKKARFVKRWRERGVDAETIARITCPIGIPGIADKAPAAIAIAVAAQLLQVDEALRAARAGEGAARRASPAA